MHFIRRNIRALRAYLRRNIRALRAYLITRSYKSKSLQYIFEDIYKQGRWGKSEDGRFNSGSGSTQQAVEPYSKLIREYILRHGIKKVVDLGCGDFRAGKGIIQDMDIDYTGVDVVRPLIAELNDTYAFASVRFCCLNIVEDDLPTGDLYLIRQVFQHLSNDQINCVLDKIFQKKPLPHVIITEHLPSDNKVAWNKDKAAGPDIRMYYNSGVYLEHPPFSMHIQTLLSIPQPFNGIDAILRTSLVRPLT